MLNKNKTYVVGTFKNLEVREDQKNGKKYIAGKFDVEVSDENIVEHKFFSYATTQKGKVSKKYQNYLDLDSYLDRRVKVTGAISSRSFYNNREGQIIHYNEINTAFVNLAKETDKNTTSFEYEGYVVKPLHERLNKEEELIAYEIEVGQANYGGNLEIAKFTVDPDNAEMIESIQTHYTKHTTISILGEIHHRVSIVQEEEEVMFGKPTTKEYRNVIKSFKITGGQEPIVGELAYTDKQIEKLESSYQDYLVSLEEEAKKESESGQTTVEANPAKSDKSGLL